MKRLILLSVILIVGCVFTQDDIEYINKRHSIGIGFTNKTYNIIRYTYDIKLSNNTAIFTMLGYPQLFGLGHTIQSNYNSNGMLVGMGVGLGAGGNSFATLSVSYQWKLSKSTNFFSLGINNVFFYEEPSFSFLPVISIDKRF